MLPSHSEGSPNVLLEAMAAGLPIVAANVGGVPEIVTAGQEAILVEKHKPLAIAEAVAQLLSDAELRNRVSDAAQRALGIHCDRLL